MGIFSRIKRFLHRAETTEYYWNTRTKARQGSIFYLIRHRRLMQKYGASIPYSAEIMGMPVFPHGLYGIFISQGATIGKNCVIFHHVTIGSNTLPDSKGNGFPVIGDNVFIGTGARIIGNVHIGDNVRIGANCVVAKDVPANTTVVLPKPVYIQRDTPLDNRFIGV